MGNFEGHVDFKRQDHFEGKFDRLFLLSVHFSPPADSIEISTG